MGQSGPKQQCIMIIGIKSAAKCSPHSYIHIALCNLSFLARLTGIAL